MNVCVFAKSVDHGKLRFMGCKFQNPNTCLLIFFFFVNFQIGLRQDWPQT